jgi:hypothetical protein
VRIARVLVGLTLASLLLDVCEPSAGALFRFDAPDTVSHAVERRTNDLVTREEPVPDTVVLGVASAGSAPAATARRLPPTPPHEVPALARRSLSAVECSRALGDG